MNVMKAGQPKNMIFCTYFYLNFEFTYIPDRCMEHSLHIACMHFVETIAPASLKSIHKKVHAALKNAMSTEGDLDLDELDASLTDFDLDNLEDPNDKDGEDSDDEVGFTQVMLLVRH